MPMTDTKPSDVEPVAWRWRYIRESGPAHWIVRGTPRQSLPATHGFCAVEAEPLYSATTLAAQQARIGHMERALKRIAEGDEPRPVSTSWFPAEAISMMAHYPGMPWNSQRWDVDHKGYADAYYKAFPKTKEPS